MESVEPGPWRGPLWEGMEQGGAPPKAAGQGVGGQPNTASLKAPCFSLRELPYLKYPLHISAQAHSHLWLMVIALTLSLEKA